MPLVYTKEEIKNYLHSRGFDVTNEAIISQFIHDLKKLVKFEDRQRRRVRLGHDAHDTNLDSTGQSGDVVVTGDNSNHIRDSNRTHTTGEVTSDLRRHGKDGRQNKVSESEFPAKVAPQQQQDGQNRSSRDWHTSDEDTVDHIRGHRDVQNVHNKNWFPKHVNGKSDSLRGTTAKGKLPLQTIREQNDMSVHSIRKNSIGNAESNGLVMSRKTLRLENGDPVIEESLVPIGNDGHNKRRTRPFTATGVATLDEHQTESRVPDFHENESYLSKLRVPSSRLQGPDMLRILGRLLEESDKDGDVESFATTKSLRGPPNRVRRDPVALYHYYKKYWDKLKIPGEDRHMQTRWNVRAQTVGNYPCFEGQPVNYLSRH